MITERDLSELCQTILTGVTVGLGSLVMLFASGAQILVQCAFECIEGNVTQCGHGEDVSTMHILFGYLNHRIEGAEMDREAELILHFEDGKCIRIVPERNGLESYVITTRYGVCPVAVS